jgi:hypothetical protein
MRVDNITRLHEKEGGENGGEVGAMQKLNSTQLRRASAAPRPASNSSHNVCPYDRNARLFV